jgi:hypothetical protein
MPLLLGAVAEGATPAQIAPTNQTLTPTATPGAIFQPLNPGLASAPGLAVGQASAVALSPDGRTLLILTSGYNRMFGGDGRFIPEQSSEWLFVYDVGRPRLCVRRCRRHSHRI